MAHLEAEDHADIFIPHAFDEHIVDLGEVRMNYSVVGESTQPALLLIPAQTESWWGYEQVMPLLAERFHVHAVDLRGQGRSTWTPGRYTVDNMGNDLVRFIDLVIGRPTIVAGLSSGGVLSAWLSAYAKPGQIRAAMLENPPLFASEAVTSCGQPINQGMGPAFSLWHKWLGDQWSIGDWKGMQAATSQELPQPLLRALRDILPRVEGVGGMTSPVVEAGDLDEPTQNLKEYDPEWARSFVSGLATAGSDHATMLANVAVPVLFTHHFHMRDEKSGTELGAISDLQMKRVRELVTSAGQAFTYKSFPDTPLSMHAHQPALYARTVIEWVAQLPG